MPFREELVDVLGRTASDAYPLFRAYEHPLASQTAGRVFVLFMDTTESAMAKLYEWEKSLTIPYFEEADLIADGESLVS